MNSLTGLSEAEKRVVQVANAAAKKQNEKKIRAKQQFDAVLQMLLSKEAKPETKVLYVRACD